MADKALRTDSGNPTSYARKKHGIGDTGKFPVFDHRSCMSAVKLRSHGSGVSESRVLAHAKRWANKNDDDECLNAIEEAKEED